MNIISFSID